MDNLDHKNKQKQFPLFKLSKDTKKEKITSYCILCKFKKFRKCSDKHSKKVVTSSDEEEFVIPQFDGANDLVNKYSHHQRGNGGNPSQNQSHVNYPPISRGQPVDRFRQDHLRSGNAGTSNIIPAQTHPNAYDNRRVPPPPSTSRRYNKSSRNAHHNPAGPPIHLDERTRPPHQANLPHQFVQSNSNIVFQQPSKVGQVSSNITPKDMYSSTQYGQSSLSSRNSVPETVPYSGITAGPLLVPSSQTFNLSNPSDYFSHDNSGINSFLPDFMEISAADLNRRRGNRNNPGSTEGSSVLRSQLARPPLNRVSKSNQQDSHDKNRPNIPPERHKNIFNSPQKVAHSNQQSSGFSPALPIQTSNEAHSQFNLIAVPQQQISPTQQNMVLLGQPSHSNFTSQKAHHHQVIINQQTPAYVTPDFIRRNSEASIGSSVSDLSEFEGRSNEQISTKVDPSNDESSDKDGDILKQAFDIAIGSDLETFGDDVDTMSEAESCASLVPCIQNPPIQNVTSNYQFVGTQEVVLPNSMNYSRPSIDNSSRKSNEINEVGKSSQVMPWISTPKASSTTDSTTPDKLKGNLKKNNKKDKRKKASPQNYNR